MTGKIMIMRWVCIGLISFSLAGCARVSESRFNPFNWFGGDRETERLTPDVEVIEDDRPLVEQVVSVRIERAPGGAILYAVGLPPTQGYWLADLLPDPDRSDLGRLAYQFRILPPDTATRVSTPASRSVTAAIFLSDQTLAGTSTVDVYGATNARSVSR